MGETPLILFATETGNAQDVADTVARQCRRIGLRCRLQDMETYSPVKLPILQSTNADFWIGRINIGKPHNLHSLYDGLGRRTALHDRAMVDAPPV